jgi:acetolactate synthase-1/2/3 large subunit
VNRTLALEPAGLGAIGPLESSVSRTLNTGLHPTICESMSESPFTRRGSEHVYEALVNAGVKVLVGLPGTQTLPLDRTIERRDDITYVMARHETAIPHVAWGYYEAGGGVAATLTVPGPGDANAAHGLKNAYDDNVPVIHISADADPSAFGKHPIHEIEPKTFDTVVKANVTVEDPFRLREVVSRGIETALAPPCGPVRLGIPSTFLAGEVHAPPAFVSPERTTYDAGSATDEAARRLARSTRPLLFIGGGARRSPDGPAAVAELATFLDAPVATSFKGKGVFPEDEPRYLGTTGGDLPAGSVAVFEAADVVLALGTDFDGPNTRDWTLPMGETLVHVDLDPGEFGASYDADVGIVADVSDACEAIADGIRDRNSAPKWDGSRLATAVRDEYEAQLRSRGLLDGEAPLSTPAVHRTVRDAVPDDAVITTDIGGHRIWSRQVFPAYARDLFVTAGSWAGMGVGLPSAIGAKLARPDRPVVCLSGDGSLFMCSQELHTAAAYDLDVTVVLFNDADYGIISKSSQLEREADDNRFSWPSPDWTAVAEGYGCSARRARTRDEVREAVGWALDADGPTLVDVAIDADEPTPVDVASYETNVDPAEY